MKKTIRSLAVFVAVSSLLLNVLPTAAFAETIDISGNGSESTNTVVTTQTNTSTVVQSNDAKIINDIKSKADSGGNEANDNTGGDVVVATGNSVSAVDVSTRVNLNEATLPAPSYSGDKSIAIEGNGSYSDNAVIATETDSSSVFQDNHAFIVNDVYSKANSGYNSANRNTDGDVTVITGHTNSVVEVTTEANANIVMPQEDSAAGSAAGYDVTITGNGAYSTNVVDLFRTNDSSIIQDNHAKIINHIKSKAVSGLNDANDNTGGDVLIDTGMADSYVLVENLANLNVATTNGVFPELLAKIKGNGSYSDNVLSSLFYDQSAVFQGSGERDSGNGLFLKNHLYGKSKSGLNDANRNTHFEGDPMIITGHTWSETVVENTGNANYYGEKPTLTLPGGTHVSFGFDLGSLFRGLFS